MQTKMARLVIGKFYVVDSMANSAEDFVISGPFDTIQEAKDDRKQINTCDDCLIAEFVLSGSGDTKRSGFRMV